MRFTPYADNFGQKPPEQQLFRPKFVNKFCELACSCVKNYAYRLKAPLCFYNDIKVGVEKD